MGTIVSIDLPAHSAIELQPNDRDELVAVAFDWFHEIERRCSRFDPDSELMQVSRTPGVAAPASPLLLDVVRFALAVADDTDGVFDPTVGLRMERAGFDVEHRSRRRVRTAIADTGATFRDVEVDDERGTITLHKPLVLDLGAVAKGLAIDLAARALAPLQHFAIDAGGDLYLAGTRATGQPWSVGIRHPSIDDQLLDSLEVSDRAVCTSGNYERRSSDNADARHIVDPRSGVTAAALISATMISPSAMLADALATAAFVMGPEDGLRLAARHDVECVLFTPSFERLSSPGASGRSRSLP